MTNCSFGMSYHFNEQFNFTVPKGRWYYFYTSHISRPEPLYFIVKSTSSVEVSLGNTTHCPSDGDPVVFDTSQSPDQFFKFGPINFADTKCINSVGVHAVDDDSFVIFRLEGQGKKVKRLTTTKKILLILATMSLTTFVYVYFFVIPPPEKYKDS